MSWHKDDHQLKRRQEEGSVRKKELKPDDPFKLIGRVVPGDPKFMATCLIEEYARMGMSAQEVLKLFRLPTYQTYALYQRYGEKWVQALIQDVFRRTGRFRAAAETRSKGEGSNG